MKENIHDLMATFIFLQNLGFNISEPMDLTDPIDKPITEEAEFEIIQPKQISQ